MDRARMRTFLAQWQLTRIRCLFPANFGKTMLCFTLVAVVSVGFAAQPQFQRLYDHYFPKNDKYRNGEYRESFDATLFGPPPKHGEDRHGFYYAFHGSPSAFHAFVNHPDQRAGGEFGLTWVKECLLLLLRLGDDQFSKLLAHEDRKTRETVGAAIEQQVDWTKHGFPKTRALYSYRYILPSHQILEKKHGNSLNRLIAAVAQEKRFSSVRFYNRDDDRGRVSVTAPKSLSTKDKIDLQDLCKKYLGEDAVVDFK